MLTIRYHLKQTRRDSTILKHLVLSFKSAQAEILGGHFAQENAKNDLGFIYDLVINNCCFMKAADGSTGGNYCKIPREVGVTTEIPSKASTEESTELLLQSVRARLVCIQEERDAT